jgi:glycerophosphoryl diester phosphodiesterase
LRFAEAMNKPLKIGHRGAKGHIAENTISSFKKAIELGCNGIEFDVHLSSDGEVVVIHDESVDRTTDGKGFIRDMSLPELRRLKILKQFYIPTLSEVIDMTDENCLINIEIKASEATKAVIKTIEKYISKQNRKYNQFLVSSFDWKALKEIREMNPEIPLGVLTQTDLELAIGFSEFIQAETIHPYFHLLTSENTKMMQSKSLKVYPWTVNEPEDIKRMLSFNVDGIISDFPERL